MSESSRTTQNRNTVNGDLVAGNKTEQKTEIVFQQTDSGRSSAPHLRELVKQFEHDKESDVSFNEMIEKLQHYSTPPKDETIVGLEKKLSAAGRERYLKYASAFKEQFSKKLASHQFSESAQKIYAYLLADVHSRFVESIWRHLGGDTDPSVIDGLVAKGILDPIEQKVNDAVPVLELTRDEIHGMLYFLTGNCHIRWN